jgi:hypothetical protein
MTLRAGIASAVITPPVGGFLEGYTANTEPSRGVHDDLHARALVIDDGSTAVAIVSCDLIGVDRRLVAQARELGSAATGIAPDHVMIAATHTHQGPAGLRRGAMGGDEALMEVTARKVAGAIAEAHRGVRDVSLKIGSTRVESVAQNRRHPEWPVDRELSVLLFDDTDVRRPPVAALVNFACHPTILYHDNRLISADYPGHAVATIEKVFPGTGALFLNGACGNVNPTWMVQEHSEAERVGRVVGAAAARLVGELRPLGNRHVVHNIRWDEHLDQPSPGELIENVRLCAASRRVELPIKSFRATDEYETLLREIEEGLENASDRDQRRELAAQLSRYQTERQVAARFATRGVQLMHPEVQAIGLGTELALLGLPGEFFVETVASIRAEAGVRHLPVACYANHYAGYIVPPEAFEQGGYEPGVTWLAPEAEAIVRREAVALAREVTARL